MWTIGTEKDNFDSAVSRQINHASAYFRGLETTLDVKNVDEISKFEDEMIDNFDRKKKKNNFKTGELVK